MENKTTAITLKESAPKEEIMESFNPKLKEEYFNAITQAQARNDLATIVKVVGIKAVA